jgi:hypothetical protein
MDLLDLLKTLADWAGKHGAWAACAIGMFVVYRNDVHKALNSWKDQTKELVGLVQKSTEAMTDNTAAIKTQSEAIERMRASIDHMRGR